MRELSGRVTIERAIDLADKDIVFSTPNINIVSAANRLLKSSKWRVPVVDHKKHLLGVYTAMDIVSKYYEKKADDILVNEFMKRSVVYAFQDESLIDVVNKMRLFSISGLPVVDDDTKVIGLIEKRDIIFDLPMDESMKAKDIMTEKPFYVKGIMENDSVEIIRTFVKTSFKRFPIVDENMNVVGLLHITAMLKNLSSVNFAWDEFIKINAKLFVSNNYLIVHEQDPVISIARGMKANIIDTVVVLNNEDKLAGIITESDILDKAVLI